MCDSTVLGVDSGETLSSFSSLPIPAPIPSFPLIHSLPKSLSISTSASASVSTSLLDTLPDELVDYICRHAREIPTLPSFDSKATWFWEPSSKYLLEMRIPPPSTIVALRLVCRRLKRVATPYMWESIDVQLRHQAKNIDARYLRSGKLRGGQGQEPYPWKRSRNSIHILEHIASNPELAGMVRVMCLRVSGYTFAALARGESESHLEMCIERLLMKTKALKAFCIDKADLLTSKAAFTLLNCKTLRLVDLRTVGFRGEGLQMFGGEVLPVLEHFGLSVFNLAYKSMNLPKNLRRVSLHCDSMSTFVRDETPISDSQLCIGTIEELAIFDKHGDVAFFVSRFFSNARMMKQQVALKELFLDLEWCHAMRMFTILANFRGPTVEKLTLRNLHRMSPRGLSDIAGFFPNVRQLALSSSTADIVPAWIVGCFQKYIESLKSLRRLEDLEWDNLGMCCFMKEAEETSGGEPVSLFPGRSRSKLSIRTASEASLAALIKLPNLRCVKMISFLSRTVTTCTMRRNPEGGCEGYDACKTDIFPDFEKSQKMIYSLYK